MDAVYVVEECAEHEGSVLLGVYTTKEKAEKSLDYLNVLDYTRTDEWLRTTYCHKTHDWYTYYTIQKIELDKRIN